VLTIEDFSSNWPEAANFFEFVKSFLKKIGLLLTGEKIGKKKAHIKMTCAFGFFLN